MRQIPDRTAYIRHDITHMAESRAQTSKKTAGSFAIGKCCSRLNSKSLGPPLRTVPMSPDVGAEQFGMLWLTASQSQQEIARFEVYQYTLQNDLAISNRTNFSNTSNLKTTREDLWQPFTCNTAVLWPYRPDTHFSKADWPLWNSVSFFALQRQQLMCDSQPWDLQSKATLQVYLPTCAVNPAFSCP